MAAAGNELAEGNPLLFPASLPHVITVAAVGNDLKAAYFSSASAAVDLSAPGVGILTATPPQFDEDGTRDGYEAVTGTSFSAPMVAAAAAWVRAAKPGYRADQVAQVLRDSAADLAGQGLGLGHRLRDAQPAARAQRARAGARPARAQRRHGVGQRQGDRPRRQPDLARRRPAPACARWSTSTRTRPTSTGSSSLPHARVRVTFKPRFGNPDLAAFTRTATSTADDEQMIGRSRRKGKKRDTLTLRNPSKRKRSAFLVVYVDRKTRTLDSRYELRVQRAKH